jgi:hypothetical protein
MRFIEAQQEEWQDNNIHPNSFLGADGASFLHFKRNSSNTAMAAAVAEAKLISFLQWLQVSPLSLPLSGNTESEREIPLELRFSHVGVWKQNKSASLVPVQRLSEAVDEASNGAYQRGRLLSA